MWSVCVCSEVVLTVIGPVGVGEELALCLYNKAFQTLCVVSFCLVSLLQIMFSKALSMTHIQNVSNFAGSAASSYRLHLILGFK